MRVVAWMLGGLVLVCGLWVYVKAPQDMCAVTALESIQSEAVLYIGDRQWTEPWVDVYPEDSDALADRLAGTEYRCVVVQPRSSDCRDLLNLLQRTQPLSRVILLGDENLRQLAGEYHVDYGNYQKDRKITWKRGF